MTTASEQSDYIVLYGITPNTYRAMIEVLADCHFRHCYLHGALETPRILYGISPETYRGLLNAWGGYSVRHTYWKGVLEMMSPRKDHDWVKTLIARMIEFMAISERIPIQSIGSTTLTSDDDEDGVQPDEAYYVANESAVRGKNTFDPEIDPPPDLTIEVDVTSSSLPRMRNFATVGIPEVWRHDGKRLHFLKLQDGEYRSIERSLAFPKVAPQDVERFLDMREEMDENSVVLAFYEWVRNKPDA